MKYSDLIQFSPIEDAIRLSDASQEGAARRLVGTYVLSPELARRLTRQVFPLLQIDRPADAKVMLVVGPRGVGKSHLLAVVSSIAERGDLLDALPGRAALTVSESAQAAGSAGVEAVAGRFRVIRAEPNAAAGSLRNQMLGRIEEYLASQSVDFTFPASSRAPRSKPAFAAMMDAFQQKFPEQGLLVTVDDLLDFLAARKPADLLLDLEFLLEFGEACRDLKLRLAAAVQQSLFDHPPFQPAQEALHRLRRRCAELVICSGDVDFAAASRIVRKTPEQRAQVEAHLARFVPFYAGMKERLGEFVDLFPLHPDYSCLFRQNVYAERRGILRTLSDAVARRLELPLPGDEPGLIACDSYWDVLRANPVSRDVPEIEAVIDYSRLLEERLAQSDTRAEDRPMARRIIHALSVHRLAAGDMYIGHGVTPADLRDKLGLFQPGLVVAEGQRPADALLAHVVKVLEEIRQSVNGPLITVRVHEGGYHLHFKKFRRFNPPELVLHWVNAIPFLLLMLSGGLMLASRFSHLDRAMLTWTVTLHKLCALIWLCAMPLTVLARLKPHWENIRTLLTWGAPDAVWMIQSLRSLYNKNAVIPPAHRFNTGQKINACLVMLYYFGFAATGVLMYWKGSVLFPWYVHTALFCATLGSVGGHLYLALLNPSTRIALGGIFHGWAPMKYIEHHHSLSLPKSLHPHDKPVSIRGIAAEVLYSRMELIILAITILMAAAGAYAFGQGRLITVRKQFAKNFADVIQPSELSTKHRIGPTAESCTKCHLFSGEIPDQKCEECHENVKARRDGKLGFHGSLKGDCRFCHREHRERSETLVPLDKKKFNHNDALFKLAGKHVQVKCDDCHKKPRPKDSPGIYYLELKHDLCTDCHRDQHTGQFAKACDTCHSPQGWTGKQLNFSHNTGSTFRLEGRHAAVDCRKCHKPPTPSAPLGAAKFKGLAQACVDCHEDPHRKQFATRCTDCHTPAGWGRKEIKFDHDKNSKFPLVAKHAQVACDKCHPPAHAGDPLGRAQFTGLKTECADCHKDPHQGQFARDCTKCHATPATWSVGKPQFEHDRDTKFTLAGKHSAVRCIQCHKPRPEGAALASAQFKGLETACDKCHAVKHPETYGPACTACHSPDAWPRKQTTFDHKNAFGFELAGRHRVAKCSACHNTPLMGVVDRARRTEYTCNACHQKNDPHKGDLGTNCSKCHSPMGWKGEDLLFDHNRMARFALDQNHEDVACLKCHEKTRWKPLDTACASCHTKFFLEQKNRK